MKSKKVSIFFCIVMIVNLVTPITQIISESSSSSSGTGGLANSPWPMFRQNPNHTGLSPYDTSTNPGKLKWTFSTGAYVMSSPAINFDGTIYFGSVDKKLYAVNPDGTLKWSFILGDQIEWSSPAIASDGTIYVGSYDSNLYAINPDGTEKWSLILHPGIVNSSPTITPDGTIYISAGPNLYAINPDGTEKWSFNKNGHGSSSAAVDIDGTIYVGSDDYKLYAINPNGTEKWSFLTRNQVSSSPAIGSDNTIYVGSADYKLYAINSNGTEKWNFTTGAGIFSSPAIGADGTIYVGSRDNKLYAINPDGTLKWSFTTGDFIYYSSPAISLDGTIYIGSLDHNLYAINPDGTEKWSFTAGSSIVSSPAIGSDGTIYVGGWDHKLYAIGTPSAPPVSITGPDQTISEGILVQFDASSSYDPDGTIETYEWDFDASDGLWWETGYPSDASEPIPTHIYGDDGIYVATLRVTDNDNLSASDTCNITVLNVDPIVEIESATMQVEIGLRIAGRKFNDVGMTLYEEGSILGYISIERQPGSPDEQMAWIPVTLDMTKTYSATVTYEPKDPPNIGGNPVWIYLKFPNGSIQKIHHTFNVQQSKNRDSEHWNHIEPWEVDLNACLIGWEFEVDYHIIDPGSDDEILTFSYGSQIKTITHLCNPLNPDPFPSPEVNPRDIYRTAILVYKGLGIITLVAKDDDNIRLGIGQGTDSIDVE